MWLCAFGLILGCALTASAAEVQRTPLDVEPVGPSQAAGNSEYQPNGSEKDLPGQRR
jgi:hypothetical protein